LAKVLKQRNRLLKNISEGVAGEGELDFWDVQLAETQEVIQKARIEFIETIGLHIPSLFVGMVPNSPEISLKYHMSPQAHSHSFLEHLKMNRYKEVAAGNSLYGPHREDIEVFWGEHPVHESMSRGQARSLMIAFKIAELQYITEKTGKKPVLLLDDIFSELDRERRERLVTVFGEYQVIMTTTELGSVEQLLKGDEKVIAL
jgi:DNA replication and repair protein RecF